MDVLPSIRGLIQDWLSFVDTEPPLQENDLPRLEYLLDALAMSRHALGPVDKLATEDGHDPPGWSAQAELRNRISRRFIAFGYYNVPEEITTGFSSASPHLGDAIDDILDITNELKQVEWLLDQGRLGDARWHFAFGYDQHWRYHLRCLLWYLEMRRFESA